MNAFQFLLKLPWILFLLALWSCNEKQLIEKPNVIILITDDQGYGDLACHGNPIIQTPNMDKLHDESIRLTNFHVDPTCSPTRAALMSGQYSHRAGVWHTIIGRNVLRKEKTTMAEIFKQSGYKTGHFGKWHLGGTYPYRPIDRGFDYWVGHGDGGTGTANDYWGNDKMNDTYLRNGKWEKFEGFSTDIYFNEAMKFIDRNKENPFFIYLATNVPHSPWNIKKEWAEEYRGKIADEHFKLAYFYASINKADQNLGRLRQYLEKNGLSENTILIFLTDNGTSGAMIRDEHGNPVGYNAGMRGFKGSEYEGGHRVPCFFHWPAGNLNDGKDENYLSAHFDLLPTLIDLCDLKQDENLKFDGISLKPVLYNQGENPMSRTLLVESQRIKYPEKWRQSCMMTDTWRLINGKELYNIIEDPGQEIDCSAQFPTIVHELRHEYEVLWDDLSVNDSVYERAVIGSVNEPVVHLFAQDWSPHPDGCKWGSPWDQSHVLSGYNCRGEWPLEAEAAGKYRITLRRWPEELDLPITAPYISKQSSDIYQSSQNGKIMPVVIPDGVAMLVKRAQIRIGEKVMEKDVNPNDASISFMVDILQGDLKLQASFILEDGDQFGPYYVIVQKL